MNKNVKNKFLVAGLTLVMMIGCCAVSTIQPSAVETVSAETENSYVYSIENETKGIVYEIDFINDYFGYSAPYQYTASGTTEDYATPAGTRLRVAYTYDACYNETTQKAEVTVSTIYFKGQDQYMVVSPDVATGKFKVDSITKVSDTQDSYSFTIPEDGYVVLTSAKSAGLLDSFAVGDTVSDIIDKSNWELKNLSSNYEYSLKLTHCMTKSGDATPYINYNCAIINRTAGTTVTAYKTRSYFVAQYSAHDKAYKVTEVYERGTATELSGTTTLVVPSNGFVVALAGYYIGSGVHATNSTQGNHTYSRGGFIDSVKVGDLLSFKDNTISFNLDLTATNNGVVTKIDARNESSVETVGKTIIYGITENEGFVKTPARLDSKLKEYAVLVTDNGHKVIAVNDGGQNDIPVHGYVISSPTSLGWEVGDIITLSNDAVVNVYDYTLDFIEANKRVRLWAIDSAIVGDTIRMYTPAYAEVNKSGTPDIEAHAFSTEATCVYDANGVAKVTNIEINRTVNKTTPIPENGFVIYSHGKMKSMVAVLEVGDTVVFNDWLAESGAVMDSVSIGEEELCSFDIDDFYAAVNVDKEINVEEYINSMVFNKRYKSTNLTLLPIENYSLPMEVKVKLVSANGYFENIYTILLKPELSKIASLSSISINDTPISDFTAETKTFEYKYEIGTSIPTVNAQPTDINATVSIEQATVDNPYAIITVTAEDSDYSWIYRIDFIVVDTTLKELYIGSIKLDVFDANTLRYDYVHNFVSAPKITAVANDENAKVTYVQAYSEDGTATVTVENQGLSRVYTVKFVPETTSENGCNSSVDSLGLLTSCGLLSVLIFVCRKKRKEND